MSPVASPAELPLVTQHPFPTPLQPGRVGPAPLRHPFATVDEADLLWMTAASWSEWQWRAVSAFAASLFAASWRLALGELCSFSGITDVTLAAFTLAVFALSFILGGFRCAGEAGWIAGTAIAVGPRPTGWTHKDLGSGRRKLALASCAAAGAFAAAAAAGTLAAWAGAALFVFCDLGAAIHFSSAEAQGFVVTRDMIS